MLATRTQLTVVFVAVTFAMATSAIAATTENGSAGEVQFVELDANSDGYVALGEWKGGRVTFESLDRDGDAVLTRTEFFFREQRYRSRKERFRELDTDRDGQVSAREWKWGAANLSVLDRNHDGFLSRREFRCGNAENYEPVSSASSSASVSRP